MENIKALIFFLAFQLDSGHNPYSDKSYNPQDADALHVLTFATQHENFFFFFHGGGGPEPPSFLGFHPEGFLVGKCAFCSK
jgi:hypothetical protein